MFHLIRRSWRLLRHSVPGRRFQDWYWHRCRSRVAKRGGRGRTLSLAGGIAVLAAGAVMLVTPGPGWLIIGLGAALLAGESLGFARVLDRLELRLRKLEAGVVALWRRAAPLARVVLLIAAAAILAGAAYGLCLLLF